MESKELILRVAEALDAKKAADIMVIDIAEKSSFADYFLLASGSFKVKLARGCFRHRKRKRKRAECQGLRSIQQQFYNGFAAVGAGAFVNFARAYAARIQAAYLRQRTLAQFSVKRAAPILHSQGTLPIIARQNLRIGFRGRVQRKMQRTIQLLAQFG